MEYIASKIEQLYYKNQFSFLAYRMRDYITSLLQDIFKDDLDSLVRELIQVTDNAPVLCRDFLVDGCTDAYLNELRAQLSPNRPNTSEKTLKKRLRALKNNHPENQQKLDTLFAHRLQCETDQQAFLKHALMYADVSSTMNTLEFLSQGKKQLLLSQCGSPHYPDVKNCVIQIREARNAYLGHESQIPGDTASRSFFIDNAKEIKKLSELLNYAPMHAKAEEIRSLCDSAISKVQLEPLLFSALAQRISRFRSDWLNLSKFNDFTDFIKKTVYLTKEAEIKEFFDLFDFNQNAELHSVLENIMSQLSSMNSRIESLDMEKQVQETEHTELFTEDHPDVAENMPYLPSLFSYISGHLTNAQADEIFANSFVLADESVWLNDQLQSYLSYSLVPQLKRSNAKMAADWVTRARVKQVLADQTDPKYETAKTADNTISYLHAVGSMIYGPVQKNTVCNAEDNLIHLAQKNMDKRFVILTQNKAFTERLAAQDLPNVLPLMIVSNELSVRISARNRVLQFARYGSDSFDDDSDEETDPSEPKPEAPVRRFVPAAPVPVTSEFKKETGILLPVEKLPSLNDTVLTAGKEPVRLMEKLGTGGEGTVYRTDREGMAAKIYHEGMLTETRRDKLILMTAHHPRIRQLCWPEEVLFTENGEFVGFLMPAVSSDYMDLSHSVLQMAKESVRNGMMKDWDRLSLVRLCRQIVYVFIKMHEKGILMGDVNPNNIMIDVSEADRPGIIVVDCDSMQFGGYPCPVGMKAYTSPEIYKRQNTDNPHYGEFLREESDELYAVASLLFHILMLNGSPYEGKGMESIDDAIRNYNFSYRVNNSDIAQNVSGKDTPDGSYRMVWNNTYYKLKDLFAQVFTGKGSAPLPEWFDALKEYSREILNGNWTREVIPNRYWDTQDHKYNTDITCEWCGAASNMPNNRYERFKQIRRPLLCPACNTILNSMKYRPVTPELDAEIPRTFTCKVCSKPYTLDNYYDAYLTDIGTADHDRICPDCLKKTHVLKCKKKKKNVPLKVKDYLRNRNKQNYLCSDCRKEVTLTCSGCGKQFQDIFRYKDVRDKKGKDYFCQECRNKWRKS